MGFASWALLWRFGKRVISEIWDTAYFGNIIKISRDNKWNWHLWSVLQYRNLILLFYWSRSVLKQIAYLERTWFGLLIYWNKIKLAFGLVGLYFKWKLMALPMKKKRS